MANFKALEEKKNDLITRAEATLNKAKAEKRELTDDEAQELAEIRDDIRKIKETLKLDDDFVELDREKKAKDLSSKDGEGSKMTDEQREKDKPLQNTFSR